MYEAKRGWKNVVANGIIPLIIVIIYWYFGSMPISTARSAAFPSRVRKFTIYSIPLFRKI